MNTIFSRIVLFLLMLLMFGFSLPEKNEKESYILGSWEYIAPTAGLGYQKGTVEFSYKNDKLMGIVYLGNELYQMKNLIHEGNKVRAYIMVKGVQVHLYLKFKSDSFEGTVSNSVAYMRVNGFKSKKSLCE